MKLTKRVVDDLVANPERDTFVWDPELPGFGVKISKLGHRTFVLQYRHRGRSRRMSVGKVGDLTLTEARREARKLRGRIAQGTDPLREKQEARQDPTLRELGIRYVDDYAKIHKKRSSWEADERNLRLHVNSRLGHVRVSDLTRQDFADLHQQMRKTPTIANRTLAVLSKMFSLAALWGVRDDNPIRGIPRYRESRRSRFLSEQELARLGQALDSAERMGTEIAGAVPALRLLLFTGCRKGEILDLKWPDVDFDRSIIWLRDSKTGARSVPMNSPAREVLVGLYEARSADRWVVEGRYQGKQLRGLWRAWERIRDAAKLEDVRIHDLRHTHASVGAGAGLSLPVIGALLGHSSPATTDRYAHLADDHRRRASDLVGSRIATALTPPKNEGEFDDIQPLKSAHQ